MGKWLQVHDFDNAKVCMLKANYEHKLTIVCNYFFASYLASIIICQVHNLLNNVLTAPLLIKGGLILKSFSIWH